MCELPVARVEPTFPFGHVGLDFAGDEDRGVKKVYICLFTCMVTRAVHIEIVADMTTTSFLSAFPFEHSSRQMRSSARFSSASALNSFKTSWPAGAISGDTPLKELLGAADTGR
ncbi:hypothetical protein T03_1997, partial [Trichinella britovi]